MALTDLKLKTAQPAAKPYHLTDGHGLFLVVNPNGSKLWRWKYRFRGHYRLMAFGSYPILSPADYDRWLEAGDPERPPIDLLRPFPAERMTAWKVSSAGGNTKNDSPELRLPVIEE